MTLRSYQVGFGDCYLLSFDYGTEKRHVLIDFGSTGVPQDAPADLMQRVAEDIKKQCEGKLSIVVATHRHKDHISGFATNDQGNGTGDIIRACKPDAVIQPWTEDPDADPNATTATTTDTKRLRSFTATLRDMHTIAESVKNEAGHLDFSGGEKLVSQLAFLGDDNISNRSAVENLMNIGKDGRALYVNFDFDKPLGLKRELPGVKVWVLGPPTLEQTDEIRKQRASDAAEFWMLRAQEAQRLIGATEQWHSQVEGAQKFWLQQAESSKRLLNQSCPLFPEAALHSATQFTPPYTRWFIRRLHRIRGNQLLEIVRSLDKVMNNTSVILLFEVGNKKLLFPGDAQIENWAFALSKPEVRKLLAGVDVYKVGHHGSRNATPKTLFDQFDKKRKNNPSNAKVMRSFVSTMADKHGDPEKHTEVPRQSLVDALRKETNYFSTQEMKAGELSQVFNIDLSS